MNMKQIASHLRDIVNYYGAISVFFVAWLGPQRHAVSHHEQSHHEQSIYYSSCFSGHYYDLRLNGNSKHSRMVLG